MIPIRVASKQLTMFNEILFTLVRGRNITSLFTAERSESEKVDDLLKVRKERQVQQETESKAPIF